MDYSQLPSDPEHPAGTSPWQTSPGANRSNFPSEADSTPPSPNATKQPQPPSEPSESPEQPGNGHSDPATPTLSASQTSSLPEEPPPQQTNGASKQQPAYGQTSRPDIRFQGPPMTDEELRQEQIRQQRQQERYQQALHAQQHQRGPGPNRYHAGGRQGQRQPPAYRLQAKIISLERVGKKDPAIHFDVHV